MTGNGDHAICTIDNTKMSYREGSGRTKQAWEGLGGPIRMDQYTLEGIDPTLDMCCQRDYADQRKSSALRRTLQRFDVVAEKERRRRHLVSVTSGDVTNFDGCRCCYDPNSDGGEYRALLELRACRQGSSKENEIIAVEKEVECKEKKLSAADNSDDDDDEYDYLLDEVEEYADPELQMLAESRRAELEWDLLQREIAIQHGYGVHRQMHPTRVLKAAGLLLSSSRPNNTFADMPSTAVVVHLVDADSCASASLDLYLESLAPKYPGTKFMRSSGRATILLNVDFLSSLSSSSSTSLSKLQPDADMPALVAIRDGLVVNICPQLRGLTITSFDDGEVDPGAVHEWLHRCGVLIERYPPSVDAMCRIRPEEEALLDNILSSKMTQQREPSISERYDCGLPNCCKTFPHEHVGEKNEVQDGLVVPEHEILAEQIVT